MRLGVAAVAAALIALAAPAMASAQQPITVNTLTDPTPNGCTPAPGGCSLREALVAGGEIVLPAGTYQLAQGALAMQLAATIDGAGARQSTIVAAPNARVLSVVEGVHTISGVTIRGGAPLPQNNGGGVNVAAAGTLSLIDTTVVGNVAQWGGGIYSAGNVALFGTTVASNVATGPEQGGGGLYLDGLSVASLTNSTVSGNSATGAGTQGGGILTAARPLLMNGVTIAGNSAALAGGGLYQLPGTAPGAETSLLNTILAQNGANCAGTLTLVQSQHNLGDDSTCPLDGTGDRPGLNPQLGPLANNGGGTDTHALPAGSPAIDAGGGSCQGLDQRGFVRVQPCDIGAYEYIPPQSPPPPPPPPPPPQGDPPVPPPVAGKSVNAFTARGTVRVKLPGSKRFVLLDGTQSLPVGTIFDTTKGRVTLIAASDNKGGTQRAWFYTGIFKLKQTKGAKPITTLQLVEKLSCGNGTGKASAAAKKKKKRQLWGDGKGRFRTEGDFSSATVRGTKWLTLDRCDSTLTRVVRGKVEVRDFVKRKTVVVRAGKQYLAKRKP